MLFYFSTPGDEKFIETEVDESKLQIDRYSMKQRNLTSGYVRAVRCVTKLANGYFYTFAYLGIWSLSRRVFGK